MDITIRQLEIFRAVVISGSVTKAAKSYGLSQPSMSQHLAKLEDTLGVQLLVRNRNGQVSLTPDGEFWFRSCEDLIRRMAQVRSEHEERQARSRAVLRLGTTPALRGGFTAAAARIGLNDPDFSKFELHYEATSGGLAQLLRLHRINMAILSEKSISGETKSFTISKLFDDAIAWAVPASVSDEDIRAVFAGGREAASVNPVLGRHVEVVSATSTRASTESWFRNNLPGSVPVLQAPTFATAVEFIAEGLATGHILVSMWPNMSEAVRSRVKLFRLTGMQRPVVLAMHRHLASHSGFARVFGALSTFCSTSYRLQMEEASARPLSDLTGPRLVARDGVRPVEISRFPMS